MHKVKKNKYEIQIADAQVHFLLLLLFLRFCTNRWHPMAAYLCLAAILFFKLCNEQMVNMNELQFKIGRFQLENWVSYDQFCDLVAILFLAAILFFWQQFCFSKFVRSLHMNFDAKSELCSSKIERVKKILAIGHQATDRQTNRPTDICTYRAPMELKILFIFNWKTN